MTQPLETLTYLVEDGVATIVLNRPQQMNAFTRQMAFELIAAFDATDSDDDVRAVVVTGVGERAFCAGMDLSAGSGTFDFAARDDGFDEDRVGDVYRDLGGRVTLRIFESLKPVVGAVNGAAAGIGASMLLPMDVRFASDSAKFGFVFTRRGIAPDGAASWFLPRVVGISTALEWALSGRLVPAAEALERHLVRALHAPDRLLPAAIAFARSLVDQTAPVSIAVTRRLMWEMLGAAHPMDAHRIDSRVIQARGASADAREGVASFLERREPRFPDRVSEGLPHFSTASKPRFS